MFRNFVTCSMQLQVNAAFVRANEVKTLYGAPSKLRARIGKWETPPREEILRWMLGDGAA